MPLMPMTTVFMRNSAAFLYLNAPLGTLRSYASRNLQVMKHKAGNNWAYSLAGGCVNEPAASHYHTVWAMLIKAIAGVPPEARMPSCVTLWAWKLACIE